MTDTNVGQTILQQLGGGRFTLMTGAKHLIAHPDGLSFRLPGGGGFTKQGINHVRIWLNALDTYDIEFSRIRGRNVKVVDTAAGIYVDQLRDVFSRATGLETSLGTMGR